MEHQSYATQMQQEQEKLLSASHHLMLTQIWNREIYKYMSIEYVCKRIEFEAAPKINDLKAGAMENWA